MVLYHLTEYKTSFKSISLLVKEKKFKTNFQDGSCGSHVGFLIITILAIFALQIIPLLPTKFPVNWPFRSAEEVHNRFARWQPSWILDQNDFSCFWSISHPNTSYQVSSQLDFWFRRRRSTDFQNGRGGGHLGFLIATILATFDL